MTITTVFSTAPSGEGTVRSANATYATARTGGTITVQPNHRVGQFLSGGTYFIYESFVQFDTSALSGQTVSDAVLHMVGISDNSTSNSGMTAAPYDFGAALPDTGDWISGASLGALTSLATMNMSAFVTSDNAFTSTGNFPAAIVTTGTTKIVVYSDNHRDASAPAAGQDVTFIDADSAGTTNDPNLVITHSAAAAGTVRNLASTGAGT